MRTSRFDGVVAGRHRKSRDRGFSLVDVLAAGAVATGVVASGGVLVSHLGDDGERTQVADLSAASAPTAKAAETVAAVVGKQTPEVAKRGFSKRSAPTKASRS